MLSCAQVSVATKLFISQTSNPSSVETGRWILQSFSSTDVHTYTFIHTNIFIHTHTLIHTHTRTSIFSLGKGLNPRILSGKLINIQLSLENQDIRQTNTNVKGSRLGLKPTQIKGEPPAITPRLCTRLFLTSCAQCVMPALTYKVVNEVLDEMPDDGVCHCHHHQRCHEKVEDSLGQRNGVSRRGFVLLVKLVIV